MRAALKRPPALMPKNSSNRISVHLRVDSDLAKVLGQVQAAHKMRKVDIYNQALRWGLVTLGELKPPAA